MAKNKSRPKRWADAIEVLRQTQSDLDANLEVLRDLQGEYQDWLDNMPEGLEDSPTGQKLDAVCEIDLEGFDSDIDDVLSECENAELPRGFGND